MSVQAGYFGEGKDRRYRNEDGSITYLKPGGGRQTLYQFLMNTGFMGKGGLQYTQPAPSKDDADFLEKRADMESDNIPTFDGKKYVYDNKKKKPPEEEERTGTDLSTGQREAGPRLNINATQDFKNLFNAGVANKDKIQQMYAGNENLQKWAAANPALAQREFNKMEQRGMIEQSTGNKLDPTTGFADINDPNIISVPGKEGTMSIAEFVKQSDQPAFSTQQDEAPVKAQDFLTKRVGSLMNKSAKDVAIEMDPNDYFKTGYNLSGLFANQ